MLVQIATHACSLSCTLAVLAVLGVAPILRLSGGTSVARRPWPLLRCWTRTALSGGARRGAAYRKNQNETVQYESTSEGRNFANKRPPKCKNIQVVAHGGGGSCAGKYLKALVNIIPTLESINIFSLDQNHLSY